MDNCDGNLRIENLRFGSIRVTLYLGLVHNILHFGGSVVLM